MILNRGSNNELYFNHGEHSHPAQNSSAASSVTNPAAISSHPPGECDIEDRADGEQQECDGVRLVEELDRNVVHLAVVDLVEVLGEVRRGGHGARPAAHPCAGTGVHWGQWKRTNRQLRLNQRFMSCTNIM